MPDYVFWLIESYLIPLVICEDGQLCQLQWGQLQVICHQNVVRDSIQIHFLIEHNGYFDSGSLVLSGEFQFKIIR